jgi:hypothetical protein
MSKSLRNLASAAFTSALLVGGLTFAAEEPPTQHDLKEFSCKDVMRLSGSEREYALAFVHGYRLGKMSTSEYDIEALAAITEKFIDYCLDNPNENALAAFEKIGQ